MKTQLLGIVKKFKLVHIMLATSSCFW